MNARLLVIATASACGRLHFDPIGGVGDGGNADGVLPGFDTRPGIDANIVFVSDTGPITTVAAADNECQATANAAGLPGTYVAWLSTTTVSASSRLGNARGWVRPDGAPFADTAADIVAGRIFYPPMVDAHFKRIVDRVATGTLGDGTVAAAANCSDFTSASGTVEIGDSSATMVSFTQVFTQGCAQTARIYCFGIDLQKQVAPTPVSGRLAFLSTPWGPGLGLADADAHCQADANAAGLGAHTFLALVGLTGATPGSRFSASGAPWVRLDGVPLAATAAQILTQSPDQPLNLTTQGTYSSASMIPVWTGAYTPIATINNINCSDWTAKASGMLCYRGTQEYADDRWYTGSLQACSLSAPLFCLEP